MKKRKQHYVWEHYLKAWAVDGHVWCRRGESVFRASTENVAHRRDFYRLKEMSSFDLECVEMLISQMPERRRDLVRGWIPHFQLFFDIKRAWEATGRHNRKMEEFLDTTINNLEEDLHESIEQEAIPLLAALRDGDAGVLNDDASFIAFSRFIATQSLRTPGVARRVVERAGATIPGFNVEASWGLLRTILATNVGANLYAGRGNLRLVFLDTVAGLELVTGDQPIVNVRGSQAGGDPPTELEYYYPLMPTRAVLLNFDYSSALRERRTLTEAEGEAYNRMIFVKSDEQIYASSERPLVDIHTPAANSPRP